MRMLLLLLMIGGAFIAGYSLGRRRSGAIGGAAGAPTVGWESEMTDRERIDPARIVRDVEPDRRDPTP